MEKNNEKLTDVTEKDVTENKTNEKGSLQFQKMSRMAVIASVVLAIMLIIGIIVTKTVGLNQIKDSVDVELGTVKELNLKAKEFFKVGDDVAKKIAFDVSKVDLGKAGEYEATANYDGKEYVIKVVVKDTTVPSVQMANRYIFTNDIANLSDLSSMVKEVKDASEYSTKLVRFEKSKELLELNDLELKNVTEGAAPFIKAEDALAVGSEEVPTEPGIYRSILEIADVHGNASYEEVFVILDTTGAAITDVEDQAVSVAKDKLNEQPELDKSLYKAVDNVDGFLDSDDLTLEVSLRDEAKHEWLVKVSYTDRAGNESFGEFLITVKEKKTSSNSGSNTQNNSSNNKNDSSDSGSDGNSSNAGNNNSDSNNNNTGVNGGYDPADTDRDGTVTAEEGMGYITPEKQACIDAGYGVVCEFDGGEWYAVLMKNSSHTIDGKDGYDILYEYLTERGLDGTLGGGWIDRDNEWYWFIMEDIYEPLTEEDDGFWS